MKEWNTKFYCQNLTKHRDNKPVLCVEGEKVCPECLEELDWLTAINDSNAAVSFPNILPIVTYPVYPKKDVIEL